MNERVLGEVDDLDRIVHIDRAIGGFGHAHRGAHAAAPLILKVVINVIISAARFLSHGLLMHPARRARALLVEDGAIGARLLREKKRSCAGHHHQQAPTKRQPLASRRKPHGAGSRPPQFGFGTPFGDIGFPRPPGLPLPGSRRRERHPPCDQQRAGDDQADAGRKPQAALRQRRSDQDRPYDVQAGAGHGPDSPLCHLTPPPQILSRGFPWLPWGRRLLQSGRAGVYRFEFFAGPRKTLTEARSRPTLGGVLIEQWPDAAWRRRSRRRRVDSDPRDLVS